MTGRASIERVDERFGIRCSCGVFKEFGARGIAQLAMGHKIGRNCDCGRYVEAGKISDGYRISREVVGHIFERDMQALDEEAANGNSA